jgi:hypothetical protein
LRKQVEQSGLGEAKFCKQLFSQFERPLLHGQASMQFAYSRHTPPAALDTPSE